MGDVPYLCATFPMVPRCSALVQLLLEEALGAVERHQKAQEFTQVLVNVTGEWPGASPECCSRCNINMKMNMIPHII